MSDAPQLNNLNEFRSLLGAHGDLAKVCKFGVQITKDIALDFMRDLAFLCSDAELPGRAIRTADIRYYGPTFAMPFQTEYNTINLTFICRNEFWERQFFDLWMGQINPKSTYDFEYRDNYCASGFDIFQFSEVGNENLEMDAKYVMSLRKAYPIAVNPQPLSWAVDDFHRLIVTFAYTDWISGADDLISKRDDKKFNIIDEPGTELVRGSVLGSFNREKI